MEPVRAGLVPWRALQRSRSKKRTDSWCWTPRGMLQEYESYGKSGIAISVSMHACADVVCGIEKITFHRASNVRAGCVGAKAV